ncbi:MAG: cobyric acid synthase CobQ, partial [Cyanobacteria bacterium P01_F01_bin.42]
VLGVIPYLPQAFSAEDSLSLFERRTSSSTAEITIAVIRFPRIANFTDFEPHEAEPGVRVNYIAPGQDLGRPDAVILPGSKTTLSDLSVLNQSGLAKQLKAYKGPILGICGGLQMLGTSVEDPNQLEGESVQQPGLNLLPLTTVITPDKVTRQREVDAIALPSLWETLTPSHPRIHGYEIHQGKTQVDNGDLIAPLWSEPGLGWVSCTQPVMGTYLHGLFNNGSWRRCWLNLIREQKGLTALPVDVPDYQEQREQIFDEIADAIAPHLDLQPIFDAQDSGPKKP